MVVSRWLVMPMRRHIGRRNIGGRQHLEHSCILRGPDFHRVLLDPSLVRIMLGQLMLRVMRKNIAVRCPNKIALELVVP